MPASGSRSNFVCPKAIFATRPSRSPIRSNRSLLLTGPEITGQTQNTPSEECERRGKNESEKNRLNGHNRHLPWFPWYERDSACRPRRTPGTPESRSRRYPERVIRLARAVVSPVYPPATPHTASFAPAHRQAHCPARRTHPCPAPSPMQQGYHDRPLFPYRASPHAGDGQVPLRLPSPFRSFAAIMTRARCSRSSIGPASRSTAHCCATNSPD